MAMILLIFPYESIEVNYSVSSDWRIVRGRGRLGLEADHLRRSPPVNLDVTDLIVRLPVYDIGGQVLHEQVL